ncbi:MAG: ribose-phosphate pyrophosphokinase [Oscillospiraceae bacterium]|jgi:ribose-phosphate pyrophosphokinase|nr:ribose-phosphate pyrophosphokinase [Oscillospiraceae bacterium]
MAENPGEYSQETLPAGQLGIVALPGCEGMAQNVDAYISQWRREHARTLPPGDISHHYVRESYIIDAKFQRFSTGEGKGVISQSVRGYDLFVLCDCFNWGVKYNMYGEERRTSPDEHFANLKRAISAAAGKERRLNVIMPMLYEGRQHRRSNRESLDCALALQELVSLGVQNIITFDAHDPRVQNAIPNCGFESVPPIYQMIKAIIRTVPDINIDNDHLMVISPDEGGMQRSIFYANMLGVDLGMFYKRRDYSVLKDGRNPIIAHEFLGDNVQGKDVIIVDDMIASGDSVIDVCTQLKNRGAERVFACATFGLFSAGLARIDAAYKSGLFDKIYTCDMVFTPPELLKREWYVPVRMSKYIAYLIDTLNHDMSISRLLTPSDRIQQLLVRKGFRLG